MKELLSRLTTAQTIATILSGLLIGAFGIVFAYWEFSDKMVQRQEAQRTNENIEQSETIALMVRAMWMNDLQKLKDSIQVDHSFLMEQAYKKDSVLVIVLPRIMQQVNEILRSVQASEAEKSISQSQSKDEKTDQIWKYLRDRDIADSLYLRDQAIMKELRSINKQLFNSPKFGDRAK